MIHIFRILKTALTLIALLTFIAVVGIIIYVNQVGFPGRYGEWLRSELADRGLHLTFDTLRYDFRDGLVATEVSFYSDAEKTTPLLEAREIKLDLDKTKALRGTFQLRDIQVTEGTARIPVDENGRLVTATHINGELSITESGRALIQNTSGVIEGLHLTLDTDLKLINGDQNKIDEKQKDALQSNHVLSIILDELSLWNFKEETPPQLNFKITGDLKTPERLHTTFTLNASELSRNDYHIQTLKITGDVQSQLVTLDDILIQDDSGSVTGQADWSVTRQEGRLRLLSDLNFQACLKNCFNISILEKLEFNKPPTLQIQGTYANNSNGPMSVKITGHGEIDQFKFLKEPYSGLSSEFSWQDGDLYLRDLEVTHPKGQLRGNILLENGLARYDLYSTLPLQAYRPFILKDSPLEDTLKGLEFNENSTIIIDANGTSDRTDLTSWSALGKAYFTNFSYRSARCHNLSSDFNFIPGQSEFSNISALLNDDAEPARLKHKGDPSQELYADRILYRNSNRITTVSNLRGKLWPTPIIRIFAPETAKAIENDFHFYQPPHLVLNGSFAGRAEDISKTIFSVSINTDGQTDYPFLGKNLPLQKLKSDVIVRGNIITAKNISASSLKGTFEGIVEANVTSNQDTKYKGSIKWDNLNFPLISKLYEFDEEEKGLLRGSIDFTGSGTEIRRFNANGLLGITKGHLVSLPILGPLSPVIAGILGKERLGYESAKEASVNFAIRKGIAQTRDFVATSKNLTLTGEGWVDLHTDQMDFIVRMNARGLLGLVALPLSPVKGILQFRGTGDYGEPDWQPAPFTLPAKGDNDPLFRKPGKALIVPE